MESTTFSSASEPKDQDMIGDVLLGEYSELDLNSDLANTDFREDLKEDLRPKNLE